MRISILDPCLSYMQRVSILSMYQMWFYRFSCCVWIAKCMYSVSSSWIHFAKSSHTGPYRLCIGYTIIYHSRILKSSYLFGPSLISCGRMNDEFISKWHCAGHPGDARCNHDIYRKLADHSLVFRRKNVWKWWIFMDLCWFCWSCTRNL